MAPVSKHVDEAFALELSIDVSEMINTTTDDLQTVSLVDAMKTRQPVEQLRTEPEAPQSNSSISEGPGGGLYHSQEACKLTQ